MPTLNITDSFINCVGKGQDHADGAQAYSPGGFAKVNVKRTCFRSYSGKEAAEKYGSGFIGSCGFFWADKMQGEVNFDEVVFWGGDRALAIYADAGVTKVNARGLYFVGEYGLWDFDIRATGGKLEIGDWDVCYATIDANGNIVRGNAIPRPV